MEDKLWLSLDPLLFICMVWPSGINVKVIEFSNNIIVVEIVDGICSWTLVGFFDPPSYSRRRSIWVELNTLMVSTQGPWVCFGDFNVLISDDEKTGGWLGVL